MHTQTHTRIDTRRHARTFTFTNTHTHTHTRCMTPTYAYHLTHTKKRTPPFSILLFVFLLLLFFALLRFFLLFLIFCLSKKPRGTCFFSLSFFLALALFCSFSLSLVLSLFPSPSLLVSPSRKLAHTRVRALSLFCPFLSCLLACVRSVSLTGLPLEKHCLSFWPSLRCIHYGTTSSPKKRQDSAYG